MNRLGLLAAAFALLWVSSCGDEPAPPPVEVPEWAHVAPEQIAEAEKHGVPVAFENDLGMRFVLIPAGTFLMGSPEDEEGRNEDETQHEVTISKPFYMSIYEATNGQYRALRPEHDAREIEGNRLNESAQPVVDVGVYDAAAFARFLSRNAEGRTYRLPSEGEWEWACRSGAKTAFSFGDNASDLVDYGNFYDARAFAHRGYRFFITPDCDLDDGWAVSAPVGSYRSNAWGLCDMHGNAWEMCSEGDLADGAATASFASRGGGCGSPLYAARCANRVFTQGAGLNIEGGFRLVSPLSEPER